MQTFILEKYIFGQRGNFMYRCGCQFWNIHDFDAGRRPGYSTCSSGFILLSHTMTGITSRFRKYVCDNLEAERRSRHLGPFKCILDSANTPEVHMLISNVMLKDEQSCQKQAKQTFAAILHVLNSAPATHYLATFLFFERRSFWLLEENTIMGWL
jgi:hypothetical protein